MKDRLRYGNSVIEYTIIKSKRRKTSEIHVDRNGIKVRVPLIKKDEDIRKLIDDKKQWIFKKQLQFSDSVKTRTKNLTPKYLEDRTWAMATMMGVNPSKVIIKKLKTRWGSTTKSGVINLNERLTETQRDVADYVIVHELCHLKIKSHSKKFWLLVGKFMPTYYRQKEWLDTNYPLLM
ncbi:MAG: M48 family metallopeptidase [Candidatus Nitrosotenuis sp.]